MFEKTATGKQGQHPLARYILCRGNRMVKVEFMWEPETGELETAVRILMDREKGI